MRDFRDPTRLGRVAIAALCAYIVLRGLLVAMQFGLPLDDPRLDFEAIIYLLSLLVTSVLVAMWIYRTNANAHVFSSDMTITPGWSVGWFFIPFANLVMPFRGVKETWEQSHRLAGQYEDAESPLLGWWWGLWLAGNVATSFENALSDGSPGGELAATAISIAAALALIQLVWRLSKAQLAASHGSVFA